MSDFFRGGRELPQGKSYANLKIQNKLILKTNLILSDHKESEDEGLTSEEKNSYASYLACIIYEYQLKLKYTGICLLTFLTMLNFDIAYAQKTITSDILPLEIGDTIPQKLWDMPLQVVNHPEGKDTISLAAYRGKKLIILDFWATWCGPCFESLQKLNVMLTNSSMPIDVGVLPISNEDGNKVNQYLIDKGWHFESVVKGQDLTKLFPHKTIPHLVWIIDNKVSFITGGEAFNRLNIDKVLKKDQINILLKNEDLAYNSEMPLLIDGNGGGGDELLYHRLLSKSINSRGSGSYSRDGVINYFNATVEALYYKAVQSIIPFSGKENRTIIDLPDSIKNIITPPQLSYSGDYLKDSLLEVWKSEHMYCYNFICPGMAKSIMEQCMLEDINHYFGLRYGINGNIENRKTACLALCSIDIDVNNYQTNSSDRYTRVSDTEITLKATSMASFIGHLTRKLNSYNLPVVNATGYQGLVEISLSGDLNNLTHLNTELKKYGLAIMPQHQSIDMLVIKEIL